MIKKRIITVIVALALMAAATGASGIVSDSLGLSITSSVFACDSESTSGGGC